MSALPAILKFGLTGLAAIVVLLSYQLLVRQKNGRDRPNSTMLRNIKAFMTLGIILAIVSGVFNAVELFGNLKHQRQLAEKDGEIAQLKAAAGSGTKVGDLERQLAESRSEVNRLTHTAGSDQQVRELGQQLAAVTAELDRLRSGTVDRKEFDEVGSQLAAAERKLASVDASRTAERATLFRLLADRLESDFGSKGRGKVSQVAEAQQPDAWCTLLRRAVFRHLRTLEADPEIVRGTLSHLTVRGFEELAPCVDKVAGDLHGLKVARLRWLQQSAIPALQEAELAERPQQQSQTSVAVPLPKEFRFLDPQSFGEPTEVVSDMISLEQEVSWLKERILPGG